MQCTTVLVHLRPNPLVIYPFRAQLNLRKPMSPANTTMRLNREKAVVYLHHGPREIQRFGMVAQGRDIQQR
jgi:hypothetical protein